MRPARGRGFLISGSGTTNYMFLTPANGATGTVGFRHHHLGRRRRANHQRHVRVAHGCLDPCGRDPVRQPGHSLRQRRRSRPQRGADAHPHEPWRHHAKLDRSLQYSVDPYLNGRVDDFRIYINALAASDVLALFNGTAGALASPWASQDIGSVGLPGSAGWPGDDELCDRFRRRHLGRGGRIPLRLAHPHLDRRRHAALARVNGVTVTDTWIKAGLMFRESLNANARNAFIAIIPGTNDITFQSTSSTGGGTAGSNIDVPAASPAGLLAEAPTRGQCVHALPLGGWHDVDSDGRTRDLVPADDLLCRLRGHREQQHPAHRRTSRSSSRWSPTRPPRPPD